MEQVTNLSHVIEDLMEQNNYNYAQIGKLFFESLRYNHNDRYGYGGQDEFMPHELSKVMGETMRKVKNYFVMALNNNDSPSNYEPFPRNVQEESLVGTINNLVKNNGPEIFDILGREIHQGSKIYLKKNPEAEKKNFHQSREYLRIKMHLDAL